MTRTWITTVGVLLTLLGASAVHGLSPESLKTRFETDIAAFNAQDPAAFVDAAHEDIVLFGIVSPFPVEGKPAFRQVLKQYLDDFGEVRLTPEGPAFYISGTSGVAWGHFTLVSKRADGPREYNHGRYTMTYTEVEGQWVLVAMHLSPLQSSYYFFDM